MVVLPDLHVGRGTGDAVTVFPVWYAGRTVDNFIANLDALEVAELEDGPSVQALRVANKGQWPVLLLAGQLLEGGWQNRTFVSDLIVPALTTQTIEVACVEEGRWSGSRAHQRQSRRATPRVQAALRQPTSSRQQVVWNDVRRFEVVNPTTTTSLTAHLDRMGATQQHVPLDGQRGVLIGVNGQPLMLELFGSTDALAARLPALLDAINLEVTMYAVQPAAVPSRRARRMVDRLERCTWSAQRSVGGTTAISTDSPYFTGRGLALTDGRIAHLSVLNLRHELLAVAA